MDFKSMFEHDLHELKKQNESSASEDKSENKCEVEGVVDDTYVNDNTQTEPAEQDAQKAVVADSGAFRSITDVGLSDVKVKIDTSKSAGQQTEEVIDFAATVSAAKDNTTITKVSKAKQKEIVHKAEVKAKEAAAAATEADTEVQKAKQEKFELLFETFGVKKHIPNWLLNVLMAIFAPVFIAFVIIVGIPTGFIRYLIDCIDGILIRYDSTKEERRPKLKVTVWIILALIVLAAICVTTLACLHII